jgi:molybdopterin-guanine dinucleotide biosynthesis protein A
VERIEAALLAVTDNVKVVGSNQHCIDDDGRAKGHNLPVLPDVFEKWGALGGVHTALSATDAEWAAIVACDLPFVTGDLLRRLAELRGENDAVAPIQNDGWPQPLCAFYRVAVCRPASERLIRDGERRPVTLLQSLRTRWVTFTELADLEGANYFFENVNSPDDYARAKRNDGDGSAL